jgi:hypothetical protein
MLDVQESLIHDANSPIISFAKGIHWSFILIHHRHSVILLQHGHEVILMGMVSSPSHASFVEGSPFTMAVANSEVGLEKATACSW